MEKTEVLVYNKPVVLHWSDDIIWGQTNNNQTTVTMTRILTTHGDPSEHVQQYYPPAVAVLDVDIKAIDGVISLYSKLIEKQTGQYSFQIDTGHTLFTAKQCFLNMASIEATFNATEQYDSFCFSVFILPDENNVFLEIETLQSSLKR